MQPARQINKDDELWWKLMNDDVESRGEVSKHCPGHIQTV